MNGTIGADVTYGQGPPGVGNSSLRFYGGVDSYVDLRVVNRNEIWTTNDDPDFSFSMYLNVDDVSSGTLLHYVSDEYSDDNANDESDIKQFKVFIKTGTIFVDYGAGRISSIEDAVLTENKWFHFVFSRDVNHPTAFLYINRKSTRFVASVEYVTLDDRHTRFPGYIRVGNSFNTIAAASGPLIGRVMCLKMFAMREPTDLCFDKDCDTASIVATYRFPEEDSCARFVARQDNATLHASPNIFDVLNVSKIQTCAEACVRMYPCQGFAATPINITGLIECKLSYDVTHTAFSPGSKVWELR